MQRSRAREREGEIKMSSSYSLFSLSLSLSEIYLYRLHYVNQYFRVVNICIICTCLLELRIIKEEKKLNKTFECFLWLHISFARFLSFCFTFFRVIQLPAI